MHQAVELILKRMDSNPDEFTGDSKDRWMRTLKRYEAFFSDEERKAIAEKQNAIMMKEFHNEVMSELLYGEERRQQEREVQMGLEQAKIRLQSQASVLQAHPMMNAAQGIAPGSIHSLSGSSLTVNAANIQPSTLTIGSETLDATLIQKLKSLVK